MNNKENKYIINKNNFEKDGEYGIKIIFKNNLTNLKHIFEDCKELLSIDLTKFDASEFIDMGFMFN